jgi:hypothetical protein
MSTTPPPTPSPFVRGTTNPAVFFLQDGVGRLISDDATLQYMAAGQPVRTLSDVDMASIKLGTPLPSRADGNLLVAVAQLGLPGQGQPSSIGLPAHPTTPALPTHQPTLSAQPSLPVQPVHPVTPMQPVLPVQPVLPAQPVQPTQPVQLEPAPMTFYMVGGFRRLVPDAQTLTIIQNGGSQLHSTTANDLDAIPLGPTLPSRADGIVYQGAGTTYAFLMQNGLRLPVPDATTLRDVGHAFTTAVPIAPADLANIPIGNPMPSTSKFRQPPPASVPLLLLPVRLETSFQGSELWLRVYPDDIHVNSFEPELTPDETAARATYLAQPGPDAFTVLAQKYGPERAAWTVSPAAQPGAKAAQWTQAPFTNTLPERWIVMGYQGNAPGQVLFVGPPIADSLAVGPDPKGPGPSTDDGMQWLSDFDRAIAVGMGFKIPLTGAETRGFNRIVVLGLRSQLDPAQAAARFGDLLNAHHYTDGFELLPHGAPTNNTRDTASALTSHDPNFAKLFALEQGPVLCPARPTADGDRFARALSIDPSVLAHVSGADAGQDEDAAAINAVLWPATWGYYLEQIVTGAVPSPDTILPLARDQFTLHVRARGHFPIIRVGTQPYGVLPVTWSAQWQPLEGRALDAPLMGLLTQARATWESSVANVPRISGAADPEAALVSLLGMTPSSASYAARSVIGPEYNLSYWRFIQQDPGQAWWTALTTKSLAQAGTLAATLANTRLANITFVNQYRQLTDVFVAPAPLDAQPKPAYIPQLRSLPWQAIRDLQLPAQPVPLLLLLLRHAALRQYLDTAGDLLATTNAVQPAERIEAELLGLSAGIPRPTPWDILARPFADKGPVGGYLDTAKNDPTNPVFAGFWAAFDQLASLTAEELDFAAREVMDLASYRLDAWFTSLAHFRLDQNRTAAPNSGVILGAYGWLENVVPQNAIASAGYVHAPSLAHATTAAVLRSAYLTHRSTTQSPLQIDLSSDRVRLGLDLLDGIRQGQTLGALLGYRLERSMHDAGLEPFIETLRTIAPLNNPDPNNTTSESVAVNNTIDGLALLQKIFPNGTLATGFGLPTDPTVLASLTAVLQTLNNALDAVADLTMAESVHQLLKGNIVRAGATLDAIARGDAPPPELDVVETPRAGTAFTHRLFAIAPTSDPEAETTTPRAEAEPRLNAWASALFGSLSRVHARATFTDATGHTLATAEFGLDKLGLTALDLLALQQSDGLTGELGDRLLRAAAATRPANIPATATISLIAERDSAWAPEIISIAEFLQLVRSIQTLIAAARALTPQDIVAQGDISGSIDTLELQTRTDAAEAQFRAAQTALSGAGTLDAALFAAAYFGVANAVPSLDPTQWPAQAATTSADLASRIAALDKLNSGFTRSGASADELIGQDTARLQAIFGSSFLVLPALDAAISAQWPQLWAESTALQGGDPLASITWLQRMARLRPAVSRLDSALFFAEALAEKSLINLQVAQLPVVPGDLWVALPQPAAISTSRLSLVALSPAPLPTGAPIAGLIIDEWIEVLPSAQQITGVAFHQDDPTARAPQTLLLGVRPNDFPEWTIESLEGTVLEALDLAKLRAVDPDALNALGHYLPALYFAYNAGGPTVETIATDFNLVQASTALRSN